MHVEKVPFFNFKFAYIIQEKTSTQRTNAFKTEKFHGISIAETHYLN